MYYALFFLGTSNTCQQQQAKVPLDHAASRLVKRNREFNTFTTSEGVFDAKEIPIQLTTYCEIESIHVLIP